MLYYDFVNIFNHKNLAKILTTKIGVCRYYKIVITLLLKRISIFAFSRNSKMAKIVFTTLSPAVEMKVLTSSNSQFPVGHVLDIFGPF
jgi:hypothetical protein